ncbi:MAG: HTH domain-containing protein [Micromonosporaceae bacterium]|nr:HTH domain-containing protein [Micromonosporaceae bacterium]
MSPPTGRVLALLELLQTRPGATATELAGRLSVDERTVRRDAAHLCGLGIPVRAQRGRRGGFRLMPGARDYRLAPLMLTAPEVAAVLLGLAAVTRAGLGFGALGAATASAGAKASQVLPEHLLARVDAMIADLLPGEPSGSPAPAAGLAAELAA